MRQWDIWKWLVGRRAAEGDGVAGGEGVWDGAAGVAGGGMAVVVEEQLGVGPEACPPGATLAGRRPLLVIVDLVLCSASDVAVRGARDGADLVVVGLVPDRRVELLDLVFRGLRPVPAWVLRVEAGSDAAEVHRWVRRARWRLEGPDQRIEVTVWPTSGGLAH